MCKRIDAFGRYLYCPGVCCISKVEDYSEMGDIFKFIKNSKYLSKYYSPLPAHSYHMTISPIYSKGCNPLPIHAGKTKEFDEMMEPLKVNLLIQDSLLKMEYKSVPYTVANAGMYCKKTLGIKVYSVDKKVTEKLDKTYKDIQTLFGRKDDSIFPHITLAYNYKEVPSDKKIVEGINKELSELNKMIPKRVVLNPPRIVYFDSMTRFKTDDENEHLKIHHRFTNGHIIRR